MLESKNKVFQSIVKSVDSNEGIDTGDFRLRMAQLNERFIRVTQLAQQWELVSLDQIYFFSNFRDIILSGNCHFTLAYLTHEAVCNLKHLWPLTCHWHDWPERN